MKKSLCIYLQWLAWVVALVAAGGRAAELNIFAAASLADALQAISRVYEPQSGDQLRFNFAASSTLAVQIQQGAPADIFFSADEAKMDALARAGLVATDTRKALLSNTLVIVVNADHGAALTTPADLATPGIRKLALGEPQTVPAGIYAKEYLQQHGWWEQVQAKVVPTASVRACLAAVESGNVDAGIVYKTDALISQRVKIVAEIGVADGPKISYPLAVMKNSKNAAAARRFAEYLASPPARAVFMKFGFLPAP